MTTIPVDRLVVRNALADLFTAELVGIGKPVQAVYPYQVADIGTNSPVIIVTVSGSQRRNPEHSLRSASLVYLDVHVLVLYANPKATPAWTEEDSEDRLDLIEKSVTQVVIDNNGDDQKKPWMLLDFAGRTEIEPVVIGGREYRYEVIPLSAEMLAA